MFPGQGIPDFYCEAPSMSRSAHSCWSNDHNQYAVNPQYVPLMPESICPVWQLPSLRNDMEPLWQIKGTWSDNKKAKAIVKRKRKRTVFTMYQTEVLEDMYKINQYPTREERQAISDKLNLSDKPIGTWFRNRRLRKRKEAHQPTEQGQQEGRCGENNVENVDFKDVAVIYTSPVYEPVSPASVAESNEDDNMSNWQPPDPYESLYYLFDLQTMFTL
ncbi:unnamed protein product [Arctia plantaginis]|uniref:Homeobox domain-containing protein n=1 Tax=Arctia plantaginis TaxID=874455 RepID=A0A8S0ZT61_ARCPL|nr:unnamed protein product [Arctia plantaginis]